MGYYTDFKLSADAAVDEQELNEFLNEITGYDWEDLELSGGKWYNWPKDMVVLSERYPDILFTLDGEGENPYDLWRAFYRAGKGYSEKTKIVYADFDPVKLV